jgi:hypothetical protein
MPSPQSVKKASKAADAIHAQVYTKQGEEAEADGVVTAVDGAEAPAAEQAAAAEAAAQEQAAAEMAAADEQAAADAAAQAEADAIAKREAEGTPPAELSDVEKLQSQLQSQLGRNDALRDQVNGLQQVLAQLQTQAGTPPEVQPSSLLSEDEIAEFGPDLIDVVRRAAQEQTAPLMAKIEYLENVNGQLQQSLGNVSESVATSARDALLQRLYDWNPGWEAINTDKSFLQWLEQVDAFAGRKRITMLREAFEKNDAERVIRFFEAFTSETAISSTEPGGTPATPNQPQADLSKLVAPGRSRGGPDAGSQGEKKVWTQREIAQFYRDVSAGKFAGNEKEKNLLERDIIAAANEPGRIIP